MSDRLRKPGTSVNSVAILLWLGGFRMTRVRTMCALLSLSFDLLLMRLLPLVACGSSHENTRFGSFASAREEAHHESPI